MLLAPRQQTLREITTETLIRPSTPGDPYVIKISAEHSKVGQPVLLRVPEAVTPKLEFYLKRILGENYRGPLFLQRGGTPRKDFTAVTKLVTDELLGRQVNAHKFRHAVATTFHHHPQSNDAMMRQLANAMNHDQSTQRQYYVSQQRLEAQSHMEHILMEGVREEKKDDE
jgi:integrase